MGWQPAHISLYVCSQYIYLHDLEPHTMIWVSSRYASHTCNIKTTAGAVDPKPVTRRADARWGVRIHMINIKPRVSYNTSMKWLSRGVWSLRHTPTQEGQLRRTPSCRKEFASQKRISPGFVRCDIGGIQIILGHQAYIQIATLTRGIGHVFLEWNFLEWNF